MSDSLSSDPRTTVRLDAKTIGAITALVLAITGAVELRVTVGTLSTRVERIERLLEHKTATASRDQ